MALDMTPEQKAIGKENFQRVVGKLAGQDQQGVTRRDFMRGLVAAGMVAPVSAAAYFGYTNSSFANRPVKAGLIGAGDEGGVLAGEHNPAYVQFIAYSDIRPSNQNRIFNGEPNGPRKGFNYHYGSQARQSIRLYEDYREMLRNPDIEMVVIALPLNLHAQAAIDAMRAGKHVLCEKLMAWNISQCKEMIQVARETDRLLSIGHQRHYSMLYAHAVEVINSGILGEIRHIRALWHRNGANPSGTTERINGREVPVYTNDSWRKPIPADDLAHVTRNGFDLKQAGWKDANELFRWRLYRRTGGGLMAELGSHQLDACSIFLGKVRPLAVSGVGGKFFYQDDREIEDHVFCTYEFPGKTHDRTRSNRRPDMTCDYNDTVVVTYSSINTNSFEPYGECIMGSKGTMVIEGEQNIYLWGTGGRNTSVTAATGGGGPRLDSSSSTPGETRAASAGQSSLGTAPPSRGYREEMEHFAYLIRARDEATGEERARLKPRCDGVAAMADAILALTANQAMKRNQRISFQDNWFNPELRGAENIPDGDMTVEAI